MKRVLISLIGFSLIVAWSLSNREPHYGNREVAPHAPRQTDAVSRTPFRYNQAYAITPIARFSATTRVLSRKNYYLDQSAGISPVDLALGWGPMSNDTVLEALSIRQSGRWYHWNAKAFPIPREEIQSHSANMHMIPDTGAIKRRMKQVGTGDVVTFSGFLVKVTGPDGFNWKSSLTREDTGAHACEIVYVKEFEVVEVAD